MLPSESTNVKTKFAQYHAYEDKDARVTLAKKFIEAKFFKSEAVLAYLKQRYPGIEYDFTDDKTKLEKAKSIREILGIEGGVAWKYWNEYAKAVPEQYDFKARTDNYRRANGAGDKVNVMLNYGYALLAVMITAGSKLFLAMAEAKVKELGSVHAYMDTDSIFVPPEHAQEIIDYFQPLNPYNLDINLLKPEKEDMWFYGISSKRYALYTYGNEEIKFMEGERSFKLHGLGHLTNPFPKAVDDWQAEIWEDILMLHYGEISGIDVEEKYSGLYAISRLTVSTANVLRRFKGFNAGKEWKNQIKPFNFYLVGFQVVEEDGKAIKPLMPFSSDPQKVVYEPFIDYETGKIKEGTHYFKPLSRTIMQYVEHPEHKFDGDTGILERKHVQADGVVYIGKEANNIDEQELDVKKVQEFINKKEIMENILSIPQKEAEILGVSRSRFHGIKRRI